MKKILVALSLMALTGSAMAQYHGHGLRHPGYGYYRGGPGFGWWVAPVVTGVIGYEIARSQQPVVVQQQPVIVQQQPVIVQQQPVQTQTCTDWKEIQGPDGKIYRERTCSQ
jgi:hypothetical protein